jgi:predicted RecA/RadA family phage recombinase
VVVVTTRQHEDIEMATNYASEGATLEMVAPSGGVVSDVGYVIGAAFVVALTSAPENGLFRCARVGKWRLPKAADVSGKAFAQGEAVFWDNVAKKVDKTDPANFKIGVVESAAASTAEWCTVVLSGVDVAVVGGT